MQLTVTWKYNIGDILAHTGQLVNRERRDLSSLVVVGLVYRAASPMTCSGVGYVVRLVAPSYGMRDESVARHLIEVDEIEVASFPEQPDERSAKED